MDGDRFDGMTRHLAAGISRREVLRRLAGGVIGGSLALTGLRRTGAATNVGVCHQTGSASNPFNYIEVSENAVPAHAAHGDATYVDLNTDVNNCGACGNACVAVDLCNTVSCVAGSCVNTPITYTPNACEVDCACDPGTGLFSCGALNCDDGNACTTDSCDTVVGCQYAVVNCDDGNACTADSCDSATGCVNTPISCDDNNACTTDSCDPAVGCQYAPVVCDDSNACTEDSCNPASGCVYTEIPYTPNACEVNCVCDTATGDVSCGEPDCDDGNVCTADSCDPELGCQHTPTNEDGACITEDGEAGACTAGVCEVPTCGDVTGVVSDASTGDGIAGASVSIGAQSTTTGSDGSYTIACVPVGPQTVNASATGFTSGSTPATVPPGGTVTANISLTPTTSGSEIFVVLTWNGEPRDLDSHMSGPDIENLASRFHVAYYQRDPVTYASLDVDDTNGNGPETVTVIRTSGGTGSFVPGEYRYWVHNFSTSPEFNVSNAVVTITKDATQLAQFSVSGASGSQADDIWHVVNFTLAADGMIALSTIQTLQPGGALTEL